ncbi:MAG: hypothetical protein ACFFCF_07160 [Promethearchaeota archaeon]
MTSEEVTPPKKLPLFSGPLIPIIYLRLVEALSVEHAGNPTAIEAALHSLGKTMATPLLMGLVSRYGESQKEFFPNSPDLFLNRVDEYLARNWELATGNLPDSMEFTDDRTLLLRTESCPICSQDTFEAEMDLRYCEIVSGMLEGLLQSWIENLKVPFIARVTQIAGRLQGDPQCVFQIRFTDETS